LINNLTPSDGSANSSLKPENPTLSCRQAPSDTEKEDVSVPSLGDFSKLWRYLNVPHDTPPPAVPLLEPAHEDNSEASGSSSSEARDNTGPGELAGMTKAQRKRHRRKLRKAETEVKLDIPEEEQKRANDEVKAVHDAAKEEAAEDPMKTVEPVSPCPPPRISLKNKSKSTLAALDNGPIQAGSPENRQSRYNTRSSARVAADIAPGSSDISTRALPTTISKAKKKENLSRIELRTSNSVPLVPSQVSVAMPPFLVSPPTTTLHPGILSYYSTPSAIQPSFPLISGYHTPLQQPIFQTGPLTPSSVPVGRSLNIKQREHRHETLFHKIIRDFDEDRKWLFNPTLLSNHGSSAEGIHVFVDASNILIGFNETIKRLQGLHPNSRSPSMDISFDSLVLLMERRRPVAKRILVGSSPLLPAFETAKAVGYNVHILEKVYKARELTHRQKFFREVDRVGWLQATQRQPDGDGSDPETGTAADAGPSASKPVAKFVEQGVDELLHLKICQSLLDAERPSTIVLATGDAAEAEYSDGFLAEVERALVKGWRVELVSWKKNISNAYRKKRFAAKWGERFRIIELDEYADELFDT
jgi:hypothetical protein